MWANITKVITKTIFGEVYNNIPLYLYCEDLPSDASY